MESGQKKRNAVHSFLYREIVTNKELLDDVNTLADFVQSIVDRLPPLEEYIVDSNNC